MQRELGRRFQRVSRSGMVFFPFFSACLRDSWLQFPFVLRWMFFLGFGLGFLCDVGGFPYRAENVGARVVGFFQCLQRVWRGSEWNEERRFRAVSK